MDNDSQAEQALLSAMIQDFGQQYLNTAFSIVQPDDFIYPGHKQLFLLFYRMVAANQKVTVMALTETLRIQSSLGEFLNQEYIQKLYQAREPAEMIPVYAKLVRDKATMICLEQVADLIGSSARTSDNPEEAILFSQGKLIDVADRVINKNSFMTAEESIQVVHENIEFIANNPDKPLGIPSGFRQLDLVTLGLKKQDLIYVGARPSMGKTAFMMNIAEHAAIQKSIPTVIFSMEMPHHQLMARLLSSCAEVDFRDIQTGRLSIDQRNRIENAEEKIRKAPLFINDSTGMTPGKIKLVTRQIAMKHQVTLGLLTIDYLQLMNSDKQPGKNDSLYANVGDISKNLKQAARELDIPIMCLSQLSRSLEQRQDKRPILSDLRDSGNIEQDGDMVMFLYRDEYYNRETKKPGVAEVILAKNRNGESNKIIELAWDHKRTKFRNAFESIRKS